MVRVKKCMACNAYTTHSPAYELHCDDSSTWHRCAATRHVPRVNTHAEHRCKVTERRRSNDCSATREHVRLEVCNDFGATRLQRRAKNENRVLTKKPCGRAREENVCRVTVGRGCEEP
jgi:hypothetical protein